MALARFLGGVALMAGLRVGAYLVPIPEGIIFAVNFALALLFVGIPIWSIGQAARGRWRPASAAGLILLGVVLQAIGIFGTMRTGSVLFAVFGQSALQLWTTGLGVLLATLIRERNILIPVAIFLALFDVF
ncbi:MAG: hypothetical protein C4320_08335, partial [Armatimonadota bacterium]